MKEKIFKERGEYPGFNLFFCKIGNKKGESEGFVFSNCDPEDEGKQVPNLHKIGSGVNVIGNDLFRDEHIKSPFLQSQMKKVLEESKSLGCQNEEKERVEKLANRLADSTSQMPPFSLPKFLHKWIHFSSKRRVQPALRTLFLLLLISCFAFAFSLSFLGYSSLIFLGFFLLSFSLSVSLFHHYRMQGLFVHVPFPGKLEWKTVSQTILIVTKSGNCYYFFRRTIKRNQLDKWTTLSFEGNKK